MFSKSAEGETLPATRSEAGGTSHLSADLKITGNISSAGAVEVLGEVRGDIDARALTVGTGGKVTGKIRAEKVEVKGHLDGSASCSEAVLRSSAEAKVQITYDTLVIESGAQVEGKFKYAGGKG
ncbi:bactofilin family protein [Solirhodobacter olei]|uniref:bactofilin family protein n=1 Tax=Solirhodobacter olei TaxID=2493082 RepID=UPI000FDC2483|nr:polymer-forming cytoskeletal protein [Solirhodobacter olei]